jgi:hypothetical protein
MPTEDDKNVITKPIVELTSDDLCDMFRALCNAIVALEAFTNRQNYGPAIQQLIHDLGPLSDHYVVQFDLPKLATAFAGICDRIEREDFNEDDDVEVRDGDVCVWDHSTTADQRLHYYKHRYPWLEDEILSKEEATDAPSDDAKV